MKNTLILYVIVFSLFACNENKKDNTTLLNNPNVISSDDVFAKNKLEGKTVEELRILRNEIFAKKGYIFKDSILNNYFLDQKWYKPNKNAQIVLSSSEKKTIELIKEAEIKLLKFNTPKGYQLVTKSDANGRPINQIAYDFDNDGIEDIVSLGKNIKNETEHTLFIYLSSKTKFERIKLNSNADFRIFPFQLELKKGEISYGFCEDGTSALCRTFTLKYNSKVKTFQLINYVSSYRIMYGHLSKEINLISGNYNVIKEASTITDSDNIIKTSNKGKQETKVITSDLINPKLYNYLDAIGNQFEEDVAIDDYGYQLTDCSTEIIRKLQLEFDFGALNYIGDSHVFIKELKDFVKGIDSEHFSNSDHIKFSKSYYLHRNWVLDYIKEDECEDEIVLIYDELNKTFTIQINNCALVKEDDKVIHTSEQSTFIEFKIGKNCSYAFYRISAAG